MTSNLQTTAFLSDEIEKLKTGLQEQKQLTYNSNEALSRKFNEYIERNNAKLNQLNNVIDILIKENTELKNFLVNQKYVIHPANQYPLNSNSQIVQVPTQQASSQNQITIPFAEAFLNSSVNPLSSSNSDQRQQQSQTQPQSQTQSQAPAQQSTSTSQSVNQSHQVQQHQERHQQSQSQATHHHHQAHVQQNGNVDASLAESSANNGILRFINNQYVDDDQSLNNQNGTNPNGQSSRIDFVFMDPSASRSRHYRSNSNSGYPNDSNNVVRDDDDDDDDDEDDDDNSQIDQLSPPRPGTSSRLQKSSTRQGEYDAENYDLIIHNDFNKVEDIYYEYQNSLKPQVERVQKAYKIKKIRKYQKIKALAVRIERYKELKGCSLNESFQFFDNLRIAEDNTKRSIAWLYNTLPDVLKKIGLEDQLKRNSAGA